MQLHLKNMSPLELNKCLLKFYLLARKRDSNFYNKISLTGIRAVLERQLRSIPFSKPFSIIGDCQFSDVKTSLQFSNGVANALKISLFLRPFKTAHRILHIASFPKRLPQLQFNFNAIFRDNSRKYNLTD